MYIYGASIGGSGGRVVVERMSELVCGVGRAGGGRRFGVRFVQVDAEYPEDEAVQSRTDAVAQAAYAGDHALRDALLVGVRVVADVGADGRIADAGHGGEQAREPDEPRLGGKAVQRQLEHLEGEADDDALLAAEVAYEDDEYGRLGDAREDAHVGDEVGHFLLREADDELEVDEEARVLARLGQVRQEHGDAQERYRPVRKYDLERLDLFSK